MPRYTFYTRVGSAPRRNEGAFDLHDLDAAKRMAEEIRAIEAGATAKVGVSVEVWDEAGQHLHTILSV